jgi:hypothetical protein
MVGGQGDVGPPTPVLLTSFATHITFYFYYVCTKNEEVNFNVGIVWFEGKAPS